MEKVCGFPICHHESLTGVAVHLAQNCNCYDGVYECSGIVYSFIHKCCKGPVVHNISDDFKVYKDIIDIDINSSYGSAIIAMGGIPKGKPNVFTSSLPQNTLDMYICKLDIYRVFVYQAVKY